MTSVTFYVTPDQLSELKDCSKKSGHAQSLLFRYGLFKALQSFEKGWPSAMKDVVRFKQQASEDDEY